MENTIYKEVVIIGNGPSAITLSYILDGNWPYYNGKPHSIEYLQHRLEQNISVPLVLQDLESLSEGLEGRSINPISILFDCLSHPEADLGIENASVISWLKDSTNSIDHVVLGKGLPGGSWQSMEGSTLTISPTTWMELPGWSIQEWKESRKSMSPCFRQNRASAAAVADYYLTYVSRFGLDRYFQNDAQVTSVVEIASHLWLVKGSDFSYITPHVVLATGSSDRPNQLSLVKNQKWTAPKMLDSVSELEMCLSKKLITSDHHLLVVGGGLSAADAVIAARFHGVNISHVFRRSVDDPDLIFNRLPTVMYPEYHKVHQMMKGHYEGYKSYPSSYVESIDENVTISSPDGDHILSVTHVLVLIGSQPDLSFMSINLGLDTKRAVDGKKNPVDIHVFSHECVNYPGMFAVGPLVGDNFVRFVQGGCLAVASQIIKNSANKNTKRDNS